MARLFLARLFRARLLSMTVLGCHMQNFRSLGQSLHKDDFCKNEGGGLGGPIIPNPEKAQIIRRKEDKEYFTPIVFQAFRFRSFLDC